MVIILELRTSPVDAKVKEEPNDVNKMSIPCGSLKAKVMTGGEVM